MTIGGGGVPSVPHGIMSTSLSGQGDSLERERETTCCVNRASSGGYVTHLKNPGVYSPLGSTTFPSSSTGFSIVNAAKTFAIASHIKSKAK